MVREDKPKVLDVVSAISFMRIGSLARYSGTLLAQSGTTEIWAHGPLPLRHPCASLATFSI